MVAQFRAISRTDSTDIAERFRQRAAALREEIGHRIADVIVDNSPVDTGTYIMAHIAGTGASTAEGSRSSHGKPRGQNRNQFANLARGNLYRSVSSEAISASGEIWFRNQSEHAEIVEYLLGHDVYGQAGVMADYLIREAAQGIGMAPR